MPSSLARDIAEQHAIDSSFLWLMRDAAVYSPIYDRHDLVQLDNRIDAHIKGLQQLGDIGWQCCREELDWDEPGEIFSAASVSLSLQNPEYVNELVNLGTQSPKLARALTAGFAWVGYSKSFAYINEMVKSQNPLKRKVAISAIAAMRINPGKALSRFVYDTDDDVCARTLKAIGELGRVDMLDACIEHLKNNHESCQYWAAWSVALLGKHDLAIPILQKIAESDNIFSERACDLLARIMPIEQSQEWLKQLSSNPDQYRLAVIFATALASPVLIPWLIQMCTLSEVARLAGEGVSSITGVNLIEQELVCDAAEDFANDANEKKDNENIVLDADEDLPWPNAEALDLWWTQQKPQYSPQNRYMMGQVIASDSLENIVYKGKQSLRVAASLEIALQKPEQYVYEIRAKTV